MSDQGMEFEHIVLLAELAGAAAELPDDMRIKPLSDPIPDHMVAELATWITTSETVTSDDLELSCVLIQAAAEIDTRSRLRSADVPDELIRDLVDFIDQAQAPLRQAVGSREPVADDADRVPPAMTNTLHAPTKENWRDQPHSPDLHAEAGPEREGDHHPSRSAHRNWARRAQRGRLPKSRSLLTKASDLLARLGGGDLDLIARLPQARHQFIQMALILLSTAWVASVSMSIALIDGLRISLWFAVGCGIAWGFLILNLDRLLIQNLDARGGIKRLLTVIAPRVILAAILAVIISTPLVLRIFSLNIEEHMARVKNERVFMYEDSLSTTLLAKELKDIESQISIKEGIIEGEVPSVKDPELMIARTNVANAQAVLDQKKKTADVLYAQLQCELYGSQCSAGSSGKHGMGPLLGALQKQYDAAVADTLQARQNLMTAQQQEASIRQGTLAKQSQITSIAVTEASRDLPALRQRETRVRSQVEAQRNEVMARIQDDDSLLTRMTVLEDLGRKSPSVGVAQLSLGLLFFVIEMLPMLIQIMSTLGPRTAYERVREMADQSAADLEAARQRERRRRREAEARRRREAEALGACANAHQMHQMQVILGEALSAWAARVGAQSAAASETVGRPQKASASATDTSVEPPHSELVDDRQ